MQLEGSGHPCFSTLSVCVVFVTVTALHFASNSIVCIVPVCDVCSGALHCEPVTAASTRENWCRCLSRLVDYHWICVMVPEWLDFSVAQNDF